TSNLQTELDRTKEKLETCIIKKEKEYVVLWNNWYKKCEEYKYDKILYDKAYNDMQQNIEWLQAQLGDLKGKSKDTPCVSDTLDPMSQKLEDENAQTKLITGSLQEKLHDTIYENATLRAQLFDKASEQKDVTKGTSVNTKFANQSILGKPPSSSKSKLYSATPFPNSKVILKVGETNALLKPVTSNSVQKTQELKVVNNAKVIAPGMFRINPTMNSRVDNFVSNKHVKASVRTKPITVSQPHVITKKDVNSNTNGLPSTRVESTAKTRRPQPRSNPKNDRIPSASKRIYFLGLIDKEVLLGLKLKLWWGCIVYQKFSNRTVVESTAKTRRPQPRSNPKNDRIPSASKRIYFLNNLEKEEVHHRNLLLSKTTNHRSSEGNNIKLAIRNEKSEVVCATCKQCLITANHNECVFKYVNGMNSSKNNQSANVSESANQKKLKSNVKKSKKLGSEERLASPRPSKPRTCLRWLPTRRIFYLCGKITAFSNTESDSNTSVCANASASNPQEPTSKGFLNSTFFDRFTRFRRQNSCIHPLVVL
ncbi:hypothetical protein Tco_1199446, partial [Tanacetum coccineum]